MKNRASSSLMGDLESIKSLLEEEEAAPTEAAGALDSGSTDDLFRNAMSQPVEPTAAEVPDVPPVVVSEASVADPVSPQSAPTSLDELLSEKFHSATGEALGAARSLIEAHSTDWSPQQTDELSEALRVRIDDTVRCWMSAALAAHAHELETRLLDAVQGELTRHLDALERN